MPRFWYSLYGGVRFGVGPCQSIARQAKPLRAYPIAMSGCSSTRLAPCNARTPGKRPGLSGQQYHA